MICRANVPAEQCQLEPSWGLTFEIFSILYPASMMKVVVTLYPVCFPCPFGHQASTVELLKIEEEKSKSCIWLGGITCTWGHSCLRVNYYKPHEFMRLSWATVTGIPPAAALRWKEFKVWSLPLKSRLSLHPESTTGRENKHAHTHLATTLLLRYADRKFLQNPNVKSQE